LKCPAFTGLGEDTGLLFFDLKAGGGLGGKLEFDISLDCDRASISSSVPGGSSSLLTFRKFNTRSMYARESVSRALASGYLYSAWRSALAVSPGE